MGKQNKYWSDELLMGCAVPEPDLTVHLGLPGDFSGDKGLLQQVAQVSKVENNP